MTVVRLSLVIIVTLFILIIVIIVHTPKHSFHIYDQVLYELVCILFTAVLIFCLSNKYNIQKYRYRV